MKPNWKVTYRFFVSQYPACIIALPGISRVNTANKKPLTLRDSTLFCFLHDAVHAVQRSLTLGWWWWRARSVFWSKKCWRKEKSLQLFFLETFIRNVANVIVDRQNRCYQKRASLFVCLSYKTNVWRVRGVQGAEVSTTYLKTHCFCMCLWVWLCCGERTRVLHGDFDKHKITLMLVGG